MKNRNQPPRFGIVMGMGLSFLAEKIRYMEKKVAEIPGKKPEMIATAVYVVAHLLMAIVHEPWYDEAVAWQIARCASVRDILLEIPHYEGHPPLWHLILLPFAKLGAPYELSLSLVSLIFAGSAVTLIIWKSPFPRVVRLLLPFTYFFFYQYGVISRPYCVMMLAFMLLALAYPRRNEKPGRYTLCMMLLCLTSAYGIVIAGGLAIVWCWEIWNRRKLSVLMKSVSQDRRIWWLAALLVLALLLIAGIMPRSDTYATNLKNNVEDTVSFSGRMVYIALSSLSDVLISNAFTDDSWLRTASISVSEMASTAINGIIIQMAIVVYGKKRKTLITYVVPFVLFTIFASVVYFSLHHIGVILLFLIFWLWISFALHDELEINVSLPEQDYQLIQNGIQVLCTVALLISLGWSGSAVVLDINNDYAVGRNIAGFIAENRLYEYQILSSWQLLYDGEGSLIEMNTEYNICTDNVAPYFEHNIFYNVMHGDDAKSYSRHRVPTEEENQKNIAQWCTLGYPDVLYMNPKLELMWDESELNYLDYTLVYFEPVGMIWKNNWNPGFTYLYVRNELAEELGLEEVNQIEKLQIFWE